MTPADRLNRLFKYDTWSNLKVLTLLEEHESFDRREKAVSLFCHILGSQEMWYRRITGGNLEELEVWPEFPLRKCREKIENKSRRWQDLLDQNEGKFDRTISYKNTKGEAFDTMLSDILYHVIIHGQHHRAQISTMMRISKIVPPVTDFIFYTREEDY